MISLHHQPPTKLLMSSRRNTITKIPPSHMRIIKSLPIPSGKEKVFKKVALVLWKRTPKINIKYLFSTFEIPDVLWWEGSGHCVRELLNSNHPRSLPAGKSRT